MDYQLRQLLPPLPGRVEEILAISGGLHENNEALDNARPRNIRALKLLAEGLIRDRSDDLKLLCEGLVQ